MITTITTTSIPEQQSATFQLVKFPNGVPTKLQTMVEDIRTNGVNGTLYREIGKQYEPFPAIAVKFHATFEEARLFKNRLELFKNTFCNIDANVHGIHTNILIRQVTTQIHAGEGVGDAVPTNTVAYTQTFFAMVQA